MDKAIDDSVFNRRYAETYLQYMGIGRKRMIPIKREKDMVRYREVTGDNYSSSTRMIFVYIKIQISTVG